MNEPNTEYRKNPISVNELLNMELKIPVYQRPYKWTRKNVADLLNDIGTAIEDNRCPGYDGFRYRVGTVIIHKNKGKESVTHDIVDGQQRLTTIYLILACLGVTDKYTIEYETREGDILKKIEDKAQSNIDFFYMHKAYETINNFFEEKKNQEDFKNKLLNNVKFIWYEIDKGENPVTVFTRLNMGKIPLTNAELIKALFLNRSNFGAGEGKNETLRLRQQEIASEWDTIEYTLQNDEFWLFLNQPGDKRPTRIDFIFDLICEQDALVSENKKDLQNDIGTDEYRTFRYFSNYFGFDVSDKLIACWKEVKKYFRIFSEWYNDLELYHYVGYLIEQGETVDSLVKEWGSKKTREEFITGIKGKIKESLKNCLDLNKEYETQGNPKTQCRPLLLLHNIQTVINQNKQMENSKYGLATFYKFPFHLFKLEKWDVEHIDSNTENDLSDIKEQKEWLKCVLVMFPEKTEDKKDSNDKNKDLREEIKMFIKEIENSKNNEGTVNTDNEKTGFEGLKEKIISQVHSQNRLSDAEKNMVWNFTLLDAHTNRSYGNSIFPVKRRVIIGKDQGILYEVDENLEVKETTGKIAFIPLVTKNVFLKYYNPNVNNLKEWTKEDAESYKNNILETLKEFGVKDSRSDNNEYHK